MNQPTIKSTIYFESDLHTALSRKAASVNCSVSELVNDAIRRLLQEDQEDLDAFERRDMEPTLTYSELLEDLKQHGKL